MDLIIDKRLKVARGVPEALAQRELMGEWQRRWNESDKGRWTFTLIPDIETWINRKGGELTFEVTQFLSGHGSFGSYLARIGKGRPDCTQYGVADTPEHTFFNCEKWGMEREG